MSSESLHQFLRDESGGYTIWSLAWFMVYVALGGTAVDITDVYRHQTQLQATADAAALAAIISVGAPGEDPVAEANFYAAQNMDESHNGDVLADTDITLGVWDSATRTFVAGATPVNAVHVATRRANENSNPVAMNFLRILGLIGIRTQWDVTTESVAVQGFSVCHNNGLIAGGMVSQTTGNGFYENICLHGVEGLYLRQGD